MHPGSLLTSRHHSLVLFCPCVPGSCLRSCGEGTWVSRCLMVGQVCVSLLGGWLARRGKQMRAGHLE